MQLNHWLPCLSLGGLEGLCRDGEASWVSGSTGKGPEVGLSLAWVWDPTCMKGHEMGLETEMRPRSRGPERGTRSSDLSLGQRGAMGEF